jgi:hypothetical protein
VGQGLRGISTLVSTCRRTRRPDPEAFRAPHQGVLLDSLSQRLPDGVMIRASAS